MPTVTAFLPALPAPSETPEPGLAFAKPLIAWQRQHGRFSLPWQNTKNPYHVWLSEVMLQQTQVSTVLDYYPRFLQRFPTVQALAAAPLGDVLALWSGLGYYSRARNLHRCAQRVVDEWGGQFPTRRELLQTLPGIGRSTAAAIAAFCFGAQETILDGNVKRVLTRFLGFGKDLSLAAHEQALWALAQALVPDDKALMPAYTQGLMDLGALLCTRQNPACLLCPLQKNCVAYRQGKPLHYPVKSKKTKRGSQSLYLLHAIAPDGAVYLVQREARGIWAALYCFPVFESAAQLEGGVPEGWRGRLEPQKPFKHVLTHQDLHLQPVHLRVSTMAEQEALAEVLKWQAMAGGLVSAGGWFLPEAWPSLGLPAPVSALLYASASNSNSNSNSNQLEL